MLMTCISETHHGHPVLHDGDCWACETIGDLRWRIQQIRDAVVELTEGDAIPIDRRADGCEVGKVTATITGDVAGPNGGETADPPAETGTDEDDKIKRAKVKDAACTDIVKLMAEDQEQILEKHKIKRRKIGDSVVDAIMSWRSGLVPCQELAESLQIALAAAVPPATDPADDPPTVDVDGPVVDDVIEEAHEPGEEEPPF